MYGTFGASTWSEEFLYTCACAITSNGGVFLMSSSLSVPTSIMLPRLLYYSVFHLVASFCYSFNGVGRVRNESFTDGVRFQTAMKFLCNENTVKLSTLGGHLVGFICDRGSATHMTTSWVPFYICLPFRRVHCLCK
ncbi:hypothetical protein V5799_006962 [Amblyomma americanum]|uniref:Uncharacterized protein n=1 Tax=Amblyomma americanum TaxID=6943 RepID=A0AAQ4DUW7_AMBAM